nr:Rv2175c family DNA-binding protein [Arsenicicoccus piscis]
MLARLEELVPAWLTVPDIVELTGRPVTLVRAWIKDGELVAVRRRSSEGRLIVSIPADFVTDEGPLHHLPGTLTVLADSRMSGEEAIEWLYRPDSSWRTGSAISDLLAGHKTEVRRRAQELAY